MSTLSVEDILEAARSGPMDDACIAAFVAGVVRGHVSRPQAAAWLAWAWQRTLSPTETLALTHAMTESGVRLTWGDGPVLIDKHSTGGVGDKVSLVLASLWAELGYRVPMISGRGLGHTGGTLDKLEAIPGFRTDLSVVELQRCLHDVGAFISGQTGELAPADRVLYALRNETRTVDSIPLIVASILSKKLAEGAERLVLDVKVGSGAFMPTLDKARALARTLVDVANLGGVPTEAWVTAMDQPLGQAVGNGLEVDEAAACLRGEGPADLRELTLALAGDPRAEQVLDSGRAWPRFLQMVQAQGGDPRAVERGLADPSVQVQTLYADRDGTAVAVDAGEVGMAAFVLGGGRRRAEDPVDPGVGVRVLVRVGDSIEVGRPLATVHHRDGRELEQALGRLRRAIRVEHAEARPTPLLLDQVRRVGETR